MADEHGAEALPEAPSRARPERESLLSGLARMRSGTPEPAADDRPGEDANPTDAIDDHGDEAETPAPKKRKPAAVKPDPDEDAAEADADAEEPVAEADADAEVEDPPEPDEPKPDPELERRAAALRKQEQRMRERSRADREELERDRRAHAAAIDEVAKFQAMRERAKYDPTGVLRMLGLSDDDLEPAARHIYAQTKEAAKDPKNAEAAARLMRERELQAKLDRLEARDKERDEKEKQAEAQGNAQRAVLRYVQSISKAAKPGTLAAHFIAKGGAVADKTMRRFAQIAREIADGEHADVSDGGEDAPDVHDVLTVYERLRREELEEADVDVAALLKRKPVAPVANGKKPTTAPAATAATPAKKIAAPTAAAPTGRKFRDSDERNEYLLNDIAQAKAKGKLTA